MSTVSLEAEIRTDKGKGSSRRLRRLENKVPAILYGGHKKPVSLNLLHNKLQKALEQESIYSSVFDLHVDGKVEKVILKALQRHPYKPVILHMDLQRVSAKDILVKMIPIHFINEEKAPGVKEGGMVSHTMVQVEVRCEAQHLPEFIEVDLAQLGLDEVIHLSQISLPKGVSLAVDPTTGDHDSSVVSIHMPRVVEEEEEVAVEEDENADEAEAEDGETASDDAEEDKENA